jgi:hypothetical protein
MTPQSIFVAIVAVCLVHGLVSPMLPVAMALWPVWLPEMIRPNSEVIFYGASLMVSTGTLLLSALPAALAERTGLGLENAMWLWLVGAGMMLALAVL